MGALSGALNVKSENTILRIESGDASVLGTQWRSALLIASGHNLFDLIEEAVTQAAKLSGESKPRTEKMMPDSLDYFGWCTWDAFYSSVSAEGVSAGLRSLREGGVQPRCLILDDGWQMTEIDEDYNRADTKTEKWPLKLPGNLQGLLDKPWLRRYKLGSGRKDRKAADSVSIDTSSSDNEPAELATGSSSATNGTGRARSDVDRALKGASTVAALQDVAQQSYNEGGDAGRKVGSPLKIDDRADFAASQQSALASFADDLAGGSELMTTMPALADSDYGDALRLALRQRDGVSAAEDERLLARLERLKARARIEGPDIERTLLKLAKQPQERALWKRLSQRVAGYALGLLEVFFLLTYKYIVDPAGPNSWAVSAFQWVATGPLKHNMLDFYKVSGDFTRRIVTVKANGKFSRPGATAAQRPWFSEAEDFRLFTDYLRAEFDLHFILCWHGLPAYWGGIMPNAPEFQRWRPSTVFPVPTPGLREVEPAMLWNPGVLAGIGVVEDAKGLYNSMHRYLSDAGVDGVKVDCQAGVGLVGSVIGGGTYTARRYHAALESSIADHFAGNHAINCMCHSTENLYQMQDTAVARASDDFYPREPASSAPHIAACAFNSLFIAPLCLPDWDMFQSLHPAARLHACARAVSGAAIYVSDKVGRHDFEVLRQLVLRDGSVLRAAQPALPTADCVFTDPLRDNTTALKVWTRNRFSGVVGCFHIQGSYWDRLTRRFKTQKAPASVTATISPWDVACMRDVLDALPGMWARQFAALRNGTGEVMLLDGNDGDVSITLKSADADIVTIVPLVEGVNGIRFAPFGMPLMLNCGGGVHSWQRERDGFRVGLRGEGSFVAASSEMPESVELDGETLQRGKEWTFQEGRLLVHVQRDEGSVDHTLLVRW